MAKKTKLEIENMKARYKSFPSAYMPMTRGKKTPTNELTHLVLEYCKSINLKAYRLSSQGQYDPRLKKFRPSMQKKGLMDVMILGPNGTLIGCEIKARKADKLSSYQIARREEITQSGGYFIEARTLEQFITDLTTIINTIRP